MWMTGIVMIDGEPVEARAEIRFHLGHEGPGRLLQVVELRPVFGRHNDPELVPVAHAALKEFLRLRFQAFPRVKLAPRSIPLDTIALDVSKMRIQRPASTAARRSRHMGLHDDPAHPERRQPLTTHFKRARTRPAAPKSGAAEPRLSSSPAQPGDRLSHLL
jgi:hypothetical protein